MKKRVFIDGAIMHLAIIFTGVLYVFRDFFPNSLMVDNVLDFMGMCAVLKGIFLRGNARYLKKEYSRQGGELVAHGPYSLTRNPMYLGSFSIGLGFVMIAWPWWMIPVFVLVFYLRFNRTTSKEEQELKKIFGDKYDDYCKKIPRFYPKYNKQLFKVKAHELFNLDYAFRTKEGLAIWYLPLGAIILEVLQQYFVYGQIDLIEALLIFMSAFITIIITIGLSYYRK